MRELSEVFESAWASGKAGLAKPGVELEKSEAEVEKLKAQSREIRA